MLIVHQATIGEAATGRQAAHHHPTVCKEQRRFTLKRRRNWCLPANWRKAAHGRLLARVSASCSSLSSGSKATRGNGLMGRVLHIVEGLHADSMHLLGRQLVFAIAQLDRHLALPRRKAARRAAHGGKLLLAHCLRSVGRHDVGAVRYLIRHLVRGTRTRSAYRAAVGEWFGLGRLKAT
ncbi:hypothetical protein D3C71_1299470 [compost metagenome]